MKWNEWLPYLAFIWNITSTMWSTVSCFPCRVACVWKVLMSYWDEFLSSRLVLYNRLAVNACSLYYVSPSVFVQSAQLIYFCWSWFVHIDQPCTLSYRVIGLLVSCNMLANLCIIRFSVAPVSFSTSAVRTLLPFGRPNVSAYVEKS